jgi:hypothetical protein
MLARPGASLNRAITASIDAACGLLGCAEITNLAQHSKHDSA